MFGAKPMKFYIKKLIKFNKKFKIIIKIKFSTNKNCKKLNKLKSTINTILWR